jgi:TonB-dependent starch-binding outer membrane protein SusC
MKTKQNPKTTESIPKSVSCYFKRIAMLLAFLTVSVGLFSQTRQVSGVVTDPDGVTIPGAAVKVPGSTKGVMTDIDGKFVINLTTEENKLEISFVGMKSQSIDVTGKTSIEVKLEYDMLGLDEIVVVGYGVQRKGDVTSSIASVKSDEFVKGAVKDAAQLIQGKVAGLTISNSSGDPTENAQIMLRGNTTIKAGTSPLILVDGIPGSLSSVAPEDIESMDVLKDGSAAAIYGTRGTNGVIIITTKGANQDSRSVIEYNGYATIQTIARKMDFLDAKSYRAHMADVPQFVDFGGSTDWLGEITRVPVSMNHNISVKGGSSTTNYTASVNYKYWEGLFIRSDNKQLNGRMTVNHTALDGKLKVSLTTAVNDRTYWTGGDGYSFNAYVYRQAIIRNPTDVVRTPDGKWQERSVYFYDNPVAYIKESDGENNEKEIQLNGKIIYTPVKHWNISLLASKNTYNQVRGFAQTKQHVSTTKNGVNGYASRGADANTTKLLELTSDYTLNINKHNLLLMGGYSYEDYITEDFWMTNRNFPTDLYSWNNMDMGDGIADGTATMGSSKSGSTLIAFFGRASYNFDDKYLVMASLRDEGSSKFGVNNKWGLFPAVSVGWRISREPFMANVTFISDLKLRAGYGVTGTNPYDNYQSQTSLGYSSSSDKFLSNGIWIRGIEPARNPNPDLKWETKHEYNIGLDFGLFNSKIAGSIDVYQRRTKDMLYDYEVPTPPYLISTIMSNVGVMDNSGIEVLLSSTPVQTGNFNWTTSVTFSANRNKLVSLSNDKFKATNDYFDTGYTGEPVQESTHRVRVGGPIGEFYGYKSVDIDASGKWIIEDKDGNAIPFADHNIADKKVLGNGLPKQYISWNNTFRYKNFDLEVNMRGAFGFQILNFQRMFYENPKNYAYNMLETAFDKVYGKTVLNDDLNYVSYYIENGDYWKIDNATFGYTFNVSKIPAIKSARIYASGLNLVTITGYKGIDPEVNRVGLNPGDDERDKYPTTRTFTLGVNVTF